MRKKEEEDRKSITNQQREIDCVHTATKKAEDMLARAVEELDKEKEEIASRDGVVRELEEKLEEARKITVEKDQLAEQLEENFRKEGLIFLEEARYVLMKKFLDFKGLSWRKSHETVVRDFETCMCVTGCQLQYDMVRLPSDTTEVGTSS